MADKKISQLPAATTPLAGTEVLPIVQSGVTDKVSVANLTAGRDVPVAKLNATDNVVIGTSGKGIDFSAVVHSGSTSKLLADYEVGTWTPADDSGAGLTITSVSTAHYVKVGAHVTCTMDIQFPATGSGAFARISLPFTPAANTGYAGSIGYQSIGAALFPQASAAAANFIFWDVLGSPKTNVQMSGVRAAVTFTYKSA